MADEVKVREDEDGAKSFWARHRWVKWVAGAAVVALVAIGVAVTMLMHRAEPMLRALIVERLEAEFHSRVELDSFHVSVGGGVWAEGKGLRIWPQEGARRNQTSQSEMAGADGATPGNAQDTPLIELAEFRFHAPLHYKPGVPIRIAKVELEGLVVDVPPKPQGTQSVSVPAKAVASGHGSTQDVERDAGQKAQKSPSGNGLVQFVVESVECRNAQLTLETSKPGKLPLEFAIDHLVLTQVSMDQPMKFDAQLMNPKPKGRVVSTGSVGPFTVDDLGQTPVQGDYKFQDADLGTIKGIGGTLNSTGKYQGELRDLVVDGVADVPKFELANFETPMALHTTFHAHVDGTNGDTWLEPVDATLGRSHFTAQGKVVHEQATDNGNGKNGAGHPAGHEIALTVNVKQGRIEDFLRLASKSGNAMLTGDVKVTATVDILPGIETVEKRIQINGKFGLDNAQFTDAKVQDKIGSLSMRGEGRPKDAKAGDGGDVRSTMAGDFALAKGTVALPNLVYTVPGAEIDLAGKYGIEDGKIAFTGNAKMQATVSQMVGGWKGALLKPADRFFKKDGAGTEVPIHVDGTREDPHFGIDLGKINKKTSPERPGAQ